MSDIKFNIGDWVHMYRKNLGHIKLVDPMVTGFITAIGKDRMTVMITSPALDRNNGVYFALVVKTSEVFHTSHNIHPDDLPTLIEFALDIKDKEAFDLYTDLKKIYEDMEYTSN